MWLIPWFSLKFSSMTKPMPSSMRGLHCNECTSLERLWVRMKTRIISKERYTKKPPQNTWLCCGTLKWLKSEMCNFFFLLATCSMCFPCLILQANVNWGFMVIPPRKYDIIFPTGGNSVFQGVFTWSISEHQHTHQILKQYL